MNAYFLSSLLEICRGKEWKTSPLVIVAQQQDTVSICSHSTASFLWGSEHIKEEQEIELWFCLITTNLQSSEYTMVSVMLSP